MNPPTENKKSTELLELYEKTDFALSMAKKIKQEEISEPSFWYHAIGTLNALYALREELKNRTKNVSDDILKKSIDSWFEKEEDNNKIKFFNGPRNKATHTGRVSIIRVQDRELDHIFDRAVLINNYFITIDGSSIKNMSYKKFVSKIIQALECFQQGIIEIYEHYESHNGKNQAPIEMPKSCDGDLDLSHLFE